jgi:23S rRNA pseudouridine1911/1915/1917 synthase
MVVAKSDAAHRALASQFKARTVKKTYEALVWGRPRTPGGLIEGAIGRHPTARIRMAVRPDGRAARTLYTISASFGPVSLLEVHPETGRTHQIRVHLSFIGHPIVGDRLYGGRREAPGHDRHPAHAIAAYGGLALHARRLAFTHPRTGEWREFEAPRPAEMRDLLDRLERAGEMAPGRDTRPR